MILLAIALIALSKEVCSGDVWEPADSYSWTSRTGPRYYYNDGTLRDNFYAEPRPPRSRWCSPNMGSLQDKGWEDEPIGSWKDGNIQSGDLWFGKLPCEKAKNIYRMPKDTLGVKSARAFASPLHPGKRPVLRKRSWNPPANLLKLPSLNSKIPEPRRHSDASANRFPRTPYHTTQSHDANLVGKKSLETDTLTSLDDAWEPDAQWSSKDCEEAWLPRGPDVCVISRPNEDELLNPKIPYSVPRLVPRSAPKVSFIDKIKNMFFGRTLEEASSQTPEIVSATTERPKGRTHQTYTYTNSPSNSTKQSSSTSHSPRYMQFSEKHGLSSTTRSRSKVGSAYHSAAGIARVATTPGKKATYGALLSVKPGAKLHISSSRPMTAASAYVMHQSVSSLRPASIAPAKALASSRPASVAPAKVLATSRSRSSTTDYSTSAQTGMETDHSSTYMVSSDGTITTNEPLSTATAEAESSSATSSSTAESETSSVKEGTETIDTSSFATTSTENKAEIVSATSVEASATGSTTDSSDSTDNTADEDEAEDDELLMDDEFEDEDLETETEIETVGTSSQPTSSFSSIIATTKKSKSKNKSHADDLIEILK